MRIGQRIRARGAAGESRGGRIYPCWLEWRLSAVFLSILLVFAMAAPAASVGAAQQGPVLTCSGSAENGEVTLLVTGTGFEDIMQFNLEVTYPSSLLTLSGYEYDYLEKKAQGVHPILDRSENGVVSLSVFTNDGKLTFDKSDILKLVFHTTYAGEQELVFGLTVTDCTRHTENDVLPEVSCPGSWRTTARGDADVDYDCGLVGVTGASAGGKAAVEFCLFRELGAVSGSFDIVYDPVRACYSSCVSRQAGVDVGVEQTGVGSLHVTFRSKTEGAEISSGSVLELQMVPVRNSTSATVRMGSLEMKDQYGNPLRVQASTSLTLQIRGKNENNIFSLSAPESAYAGDEVTVGLSIQKNEGFNIFDGEITFDPELLEYRSAQFQGGYLSAFHRTVTLTGEGTLRAQILEMGALSEDGQILTCTFRVKKSIKGYSYLFFSIRPEAQTFGYQSSNNDDFASLYANSDGAAIQLLGTKPETTTDAGDGKQTDTRKSNTGGSTTDTGKSNTGGSTTDTGKTNTGGTTVKTDTRTTVSLAAAKLTSATTKASGVTIKWNKVANAGGYYVMRKKGSGSYTRLVTIKKAAKVSFTDTAVKDGASYSYKVMAFKGSVIGKAKNAKTVLYLKRPMVKSVTSKKTKTLLVKASKNTKAAGYQIQVSTSSTFKTIAKSAKVSSAKAVSKTIKGLKKGKKYYVRIRTYKKSGSSTYYSVWSAKKSVKTT